MAEALYRKYRPQVFEDVVGQEPIERTLKNAISQDKVSHAYLFCGPRGTGKTTTARLLSKALLCGQGPTPDPDGTCEDCQLVAEGAHPDVYELDAASRTGVENVREEIISRVHFAPTRGRYKVYIIDEVHMLSTAAFNALLKTLEEPPAHVVFILCTTDPQKVPETIHSRCQRFDFHRISPESMVARLGAVCVAEGVEFEGEALDLIAQRAGGGLRDALTSLEQIIAFENGKVTLEGAERLLGSIDSTDLAEIVAYIGRRDIASCFRWTAAFVETGADLAQFVRDMAEHVRNLYLMALVGDDVELDVSETARQQLSSELAWFGADRAARLLGVLGDLMIELKTASNPRLSFEIALTRMTRAESDLTLESLAERIEELERNGVGGAVGFDAPFGSAGEAVSRAHIESPSGSVGGSGAFAGDSQRAQEIALPAEPGLSASASKAVRVDEGKERELVAGSPTSRGAAAGGEGPYCQESAPETRQSQPGGGSRVASLSNPAGLQRAWQGVMADVKARKAAHGVLFMNAKAAFDEAAGMVRVVFPAEASFAFNAVQKPEVQDSLAEAILKVVGEAVPFRFEQGAEQPVVAQPAQAAVQEPRIEARTAVQPQAVSAPEPEPAPTPAVAEVPYEEVPYDEVPYEEFGAVEAPATNAASVDAAGAEAGAGDAAELQAMLQASFGDGVVLSEASE